MKTGMKLMPGLLPEILVIWCPGAVKYIVGDMDDVTPHFKPGFRYLNILS